MIPHLRTLSCYPKRPCRRVQGQTLFLEPKDYSANQRSCCLDVHRLQQCGGVLCCYHVLWLMLSHRHKHQRSRTGADTATSTIQLLAHSQSQISFPFPRVLGNALMPFSVMGFVECNILSIWLYQMFFGWLFISALIDTHQSVCSS